MYFNTILIIPAALLLSVASAVQIPTSGHPQPGLTVLEPNPCASPATYLYYVCMGNNIGCCKSTPDCSSDIAFCPADDRWAPISSDETTLIPVTVSGSAFWSPLAPATVLISTSSISTSQTATVQSGLPTPVSTRTLFSGLPTAGKTSASISTVASTTTSWPSTMQHMTTFATMVLPSATSATPSTNPTSTVVPDSCKTGFEKGCKNFGSSLAGLLLALAVLAAVVCWIIYDIITCLKHPRGRRQGSMQRWASEATLVATPDTSISASEIPSRDDASLTSSRITHWTIGITTLEWFLREGVVFGPIPERTRSLDRTIQ